MYSLGPCYSDGMYLTITVSEDGDVRLYVTEGFPGIDILGEPPHTLMARGLSLVLEEGHDPMYWPHNVALVVESA